MSDYGAPNAEQLSEEGRQQAEELADALADLSIDAIGCSSFIRTRDTIRPYLEAEDRVAEIWSELAEACWQDHDIREIESLRYGRDVELAEDEQPYFELAPHEYPACRPPDGEDYAEGLERVKLAADRIQYVTNSEEYDSLLVVSHGNYLPRLIEVLVGMEPYGRFSHGNVGVTKLQRRNGYELDYNIQYTNRNPLSRSL